MAQRLAAQVERPAVSVFSSLYGRVSAVRGARSARFSWLGRTFGALRGLLVGDSTAWNGSVGCRLYGPEPFSETRGASRAFGCPFRYTATGWDTRPKGYCPALAASVSCTSTRAVGTPSTRHDGRRRAYEYRKYRRTRSPGSDWLKAWSTTALEQEGL